MHVVHDERPGWLEKVVSGFVLLGLVGLTVIGVLTWAASGTGDRAESGSSPGRDRVAEMNAVDAGPQLMEEWENAHRDFELERISHMNAMDAHRSVLEQTELQFPMGKPVHKMSDDFQFWEENVELPQFK